MILDETLRRFREGTYVLPPDVRAKEDGEYFRQLQAPVRTTELDRWGHPVAVYKHRQPDDFAHAEAYATLATIHAAEGEAEVLLLGFGPQGFYVINSERNDYADR